MSGELTKRLAHSRHYCADRLVEVKQDIAGLQTEANVLKTRLETAFDARSGPTPSPHARSGK